MAKEKVIKDNSERYLLTYADLMNLLLILFIILFAYSQVDTEKFQQLSQSLGAALGNGSPPSVVSGGKSGNSLVSFPATMPSTVIPSKMEDKEVNAATEEVHDIIESQGLTGSVNVTLQERGIVISIKNSLLFESGSAEIHKNNQAELIEIGKDILARMPNKHIRIEGHTDNIPIKGGLFRSNWHLSGYRAANVLQILVEQAGVNPKLITSVGCGEFYPMVDNDSEKNREKNRRVDIVILRDAASTGEAGADNNTNLK